MGCLKEASTLYFPHILWDIIGKWSGPVVVINFSVVPPFPFYSKYNLSGASSIDGNFAHVSDVCGKRNPV